MFDAHALYLNLQAAFEFNAEITFRKYLRSRGATKWLIAADFVVGDKGGHNDTFAFTIFAHEHDKFEDYFSEMTGALKRDLKHVKELKPENVAFLTDDRLFHFCFALGKNRHDLSSRDLAEFALSSLANHIEQWPNSVAKADWLLKVAKLIQRAKKTSFNYALLYDIVLLGTLAAYLAMLVAKHALVEKIMWVFDRDALTIGFDKIALDFAALNFGFLCDFEGIPRQHIITYAAVDQEAANGKSAWYDELIRPADYIAGTLARWDFAQNPETPVSLKVNQLLDGVVSENPRLQVFLARFNIFGATFFNARVFKKDQPNRAAYHHNKDDVVDYLVAKFLKRHKKKQPSIRRRALRGTPYNQIDLQIWWRDGLNR